MDLIFSLEQNIVREILKVLCGKILFSCFFDLEKAYDRVRRDKLSKVLQHYGVDDQLLRDVKSLYCQTSISVLVNGKQSNLFQEGITFVSARVRFVTSPFYGLHELDRQMQQS